MKILTTALLVMTTASPALAIWADFSPFEEPAYVRRFPVTATEVREIASEPGSPAREARVAGGKEAVLRFVRENHGACRVTLSSDDGFSAVISGSWPCGVQVAECELNGDGRVDYVIVTHSGGCGLAGQITTVTFVLSSLQGYAARSVLSFDADVADLVDLNGDGRPEFVHGMFVPGGMGADGRSHNYWVYDLIGFCGIEIVSANSADSRFPKWIMYAFQENHRATAQLTGEQKKRLWLRAWREVDRYSPGESLSKVAQFAEEQKQRRGAVE
jgi:hypothetical protein